jgi:RluA family pseudouridine synthase
MAKPMEIQLPDCDPIPILYEDRSILAIDKPAGWILAPMSWQRTQRNLLAAIASSLIAGDFWARSRNLKFLRFIHRLDADTSGVMLFAKSIGALESFSDLFAMRRVEKVYLAVTNREPKEREWTCKLPLAPDAIQHGRVRIDPAGKASETAFRVLATAGKLHLIECRPVTGRQHQIRVHLLASGCPILGDRLYGPPDKRTLALRAAGIAFWNPFTRKPVGIRAPWEPFIQLYGFPRDAARIEFRSLDQPPDWRVRRDEMPNLDEPDEEAGEESAHAPAEELRGERREFPRGPREDFRPTQRGPRRDFRSGPPRGNTGGFDPRERDARGGSWGKRPDSEYRPPRDSSSAPERRGPRPPQGSFSERAPRPGFGPRPQRGPGPNPGPRPPGKYRPPGR